jgi:tRNA (guanine10-N2)-dimethyltransferase
MVNLSRLRPGMVYLDPFCGTGGFAIEACLLGAGRVECGDVDWEMASGSILNLERYCPRGVWGVFAWNAARLPVAPGSVDAVATDPPYGRSTSTRRMGYRRLVSMFLERAREAVRSGGYIVYAGPAERRPQDLARAAGLEVVAYAETFVHGSLTRGVVVARAP